MTELEHLLDVLDYTNEEKKTSIEEIGTLQMIKT